MRVKRQKTCRRTMRFYKMAFGVQEPFRVVVDGTFLSHALESKIHVKEQLPKLLDGRVTPMVTDCIMNELRSLGGRALGAAIIAKGYYRLKCTHGGPISAAACVQHQLDGGSSKQLDGGNRRGLLVATQDAELAKAVRERPGVPLIRLSGQVPYLEEPSSASKAAKVAGEAVRLKASEWELPRLPELRDTQRMAEAKALMPPKKRKGPKGANPMSCMKPKKKQPQPQSQPQATAAAAAAAPAPAAEPARQAKRVRSRKMGTRRAGEPAWPAGAQATINLSFSFLPPPFALRCTFSRALAAFDLERIPAEERTLEASCQAARLLVGRAAQAATLWERLLPEEPLRRAVSLEHFELAVGEDSELFLRNLSSTGTLVNGKTITDTVRVQHADVITIRASAREDTAVVCFRLSVAGEQEDEDSVFSDCPSCSSLAEAGRPRLATESTIIDSGYFAASTPLLGLLPRESTALQREWMCLQREGTLLREWTSGSRALDDDCRRDAAVRPPPVAAVRWPIMSAVREEQGDIEI